MKESPFTAKMMMEMRMWICCMCMVSYVKVSDMFSVSKAKHYAA